MVIIFYNKNHFLNEICFILLIKLLLNLYFINISPICISNILNKINNCKIIKKYSVFKTKEKMEK